MDSPAKVAGACGARGAGPGAGPGRGWGRAQATGMALLLLLGQLLALMGHGGAFYLEVRELEEKCFIQEIPDGTVVIGARARHSRPCPPCTQSPERGGEWGAVVPAQVRTFPPLLGVGWGGREWVDRSLAKASSLLIVRGAESYPDWKDGKEVVLEKGGEAEGLGQDPQTRDLPVPRPPPPTTMTWSRGWTECTSVGSPLGNYKTELYDPAMEKYQPSPQWINLFVFVKDPENKVRQAFTPCRPPNAQRQCVALSGPSFLTEGSVSSQAG